jgi:hypothetical protein
MSNKQSKEQQKQQALKIEGMRAEVNERELRARFAKANFEIMDYSLRAEKIQPEYKEYVLRERQREQEAEDTYNKFLEGIQKVEQSPVEEESEAGVLVTENNSHTLTEEDFINNPELRGKVEVGEEIELGPTTNEGE